MTATPAAVTPALMIRTPSAMPTTPIASPMSPKIRPMPAVPMICSPHVFLSSEALRLMAAMGPTPSTTRTGTTRNVMMFQARPPSAATMAPAIPPRSRSACSTQADGGGDGRPAEDGADVAPGAAQAVAERRVAALEADHRGAHEGRVEEDDDQVLHEVEEHEQHPGAHRDALVAGERLPVAREDARDDERRRHDHHGDGRDDGEDHQLLVLPEHAPAHLDQLHAATPAAHASSSSPRALPGASALPARTGRSPLWISTLPGRG